MPDVRRGESGRRIVDVAKKSSSKKKQTVAETSIADAYWDHLLEHGAPPASVFKFCKDHGISEREFYNEHGSFESIEANFWQQTVDDTLATLKADKDVELYDSRQLLLAFYYTYFEQALDYRSRFLLRFPSLKSMGASTLKGFRHAFKEFAASLMAKAREEGVVTDVKRINDLQERGLYPQFRFLIDFYVKDSSRGFEDTDALIEKSVRFFFDTARLPAFESTVDLFRFLLPRLR